MATIRNCGPAVSKGQLGVQIRRKGYPAQRKNFETKTDAQAWARMVESQIDRDAARSCANDFPLDESPSR